MSDSEFTVLMSLIIIIALCGVSLLSKKKDDDNDNDKGGIA